MCRNKKNGVNGIFQNLEHKRTSTDEMAVKAIQTSHLLNKSMNARLTYFISILPDYSHTPLYPHDPTMSCQCLSSIECFYKNPSFKCLWLFNNYKTD